jgi:hypothetical protein
VVGHADCAVRACRVGARYARKRLCVDRLRADFLPLLLASATRDLLLASDLKHSLRDQLPLLLLDVFLGLLKVLELHLVSNGFLEDGPKKRKQTSSGSQTRIFSFRRLYRI